ncbi:UNVERIFIED_CONTAM: hypothetical protein Sradi_6535500 [Sesamum radiatum]|uniref:Uncharacterized protein n=1 Tax=Sesamum radiatum TaxID=300843 RepID=A0AAW2JVU8_SESRA
MVEIERIENVLEDLSSKEEVMWKQQAKALWLAEGDRNTSFSHVKANERRLHKEIRKIKNTQGQDVDDSEGIHKVIMDYFGSLFNSMRHRKESMERVLASMEKRVTEVMNDGLIRPFTLNEITRALHQMHLLKYPGPDGMSPIFFQKY